MFSDVLPSSQHTSINAKWPSPLNKNTMQLKDKKYIPSLFQKKTFLTQKVQNSHISEQNSKHITTYILHAE